MSDPLPYLQIGASCEDAELTVLLLHGLGADGHDFADVAEMLCAAALPRRWRFVLPHAEAIPVTINMGMTMPAWYDILALSHPRTVDWDTVAKSEEQIESLLAKECAPKIFLAGFSQGGAMALRVGLKKQDSLAGILALSGYLLEDDAHPIPQPIGSPAIALYHGEEDEVIPCQAAHTTLSLLKKNLYSPSLKTYPGLGHSVSQEEIQDLFNWLSEQEG